MPISERGGRPVYYEEHGTGFPVLMITGMAATMDWFHYNIPAFAERYRVVAQDLPGSNREGVPAAPGPYSTRELVADSIGILDELGIERAHVVALSFGGMIAQWLAIDHPERVERLSIVGNGLGRMPKEIAEAAAGAAAAEQSEEDMVRIVRQMTFSEDFPERQPQRWAFFLREIHGKPARPQTQQAQLEASLRHDAMDRLAEVRAEVQLLAGELDTVNARYAPELAAAIPHCELNVLPGMNHGLNLEFAETYNDIVLRFLGSGSPGE
ncbi:alpha/beta fold hydrolase [Amycolatopsis cihanbeyliensis]|uniref:3-oxoadipate enol-lactonase n=1 Tax=Amycolatopsis cihanbeyliensis TaxID=1128664 RepID=A0A542DQP4_AMYCI|nr:alpha/beta hydrolase [Amycolatopsis cihanbeyliensis]TQJ05314.1 3-oxoadipate enol-lactonase [Amycolatopsis cihanbeyliensis]